MYVIQDKKTRNYLSDLSFNLIDGDWIYMSFTGKLGTKFYAKKADAQKTLDELQQYNTQSGFNRVLHIIEVNPDELPLGETKFISKNTNKYSQAMYKNIDFAI